jgi:hypothetical protein
MRYSRRTIGKRRRPTRDSSRGAIVVSFLALLLAAGLFVQTGTSLRERKNDSAVAQPSDEEIYTGSILFVPYEGNNCRQNLFDNLTGRLWQSGFVPCDAAQTPSMPQTQQWSAARVDAIRSGFRGR